jgi:hypothetical protein
LHFAGGHHGRAGSTKADVLLQTAAEHGEWTFVVEPAVARHHERHHVPRVVVAERAMRRRRLVPGRG